MLNQLKLKTKTFGSFMVLLILTGGIGFIGWNGLQSTNERIQSRDDLTKMVEWLLQARRHEKNFILRGDKKWIDDVNNIISQLKKQAQETKKKFNDPLDIQGMDKLLETTKLYEKAIGQLFEIKTTKSKEDQDKLIPEIDKVLLETGRAVEKECNVIRLNQKRKMEAQMASTQTGIIGGAIITLLLGLGMAYFMCRDITQPIKQVAEGLIEGSDQVASAAGQISAASQSLAEGASEQAAGLEETSSSIEEMASMTRQNAENSMQANTLMRDTSRVVEEANQAMKALTQSMLEITSASEETGKIIKTIDEIAFQTNLLALNAAVEAARAGEAGAGFAVVADEVRNLAMRAAEAAQNTSQLIDDTVKKIKNGSDIVGKSNEAFEKVAVGARKVTDLVGEIAAASQEQAQGIDQINKAVSEMDRVVQQNAASAEESASASEEMNTRAEEMKDFVRELVLIIEGHKARKGYPPVEALGGSKQKSKRLSGGGLPGLKANTQKAIAFSHS